MTKHDKIYVPNDLDQLATTWMLFNLKKSEYPLCGLDEKKLHQLLDHMYEIRFMDKEAHQRLDRILQLFK
jgi:hypothetical protein